MQHLCFATLVLPDDNITLFGFCSFVLFVLIRRTRNIFLSE
jgi:hypothetical protein